MIQNKILNHNIFLTLHSASFLKVHFTVQPFLPCDFGELNEELKNARIVEITG